MHIVVIGWLYVVLLMALTEPSFTSGVVTFLLYGLFPLGIVVYLGQAPARRRLRQRAEQAEARAATPAPEPSAPPAAPSAAGGRVDPDQ